jgi:hypothetical protein
MDTQLTLSFLATPILSHVPDIRACHGTAEAHIIPSLIASSNTLSWEAAPSSFGEISSADVQGRRQGRKGVAAATADQVHAVQSSKSACTRHANGP